MERLQSPTSSRIREKVEEEKPLASFGGKNKEAFDNIVKPSINTREDLAQEEKEAFANIVKPSIDTQEEKDPNFDRKLDVVTAGARPYIKDHLLHRISRDNCKTIVSYVLAMQTEVGPSENYRIDTLYKLKQFAEFHNPKPFEQMTRQDVIDYLDRLRKPETVDPLHQWVGSYELQRIVLLRFFRWLNAPDLPHSQRPTPAIMQNIPRIKRKEKSIYRPFDVWTAEEDSLFFKYCPSVRDKAWHAVSRDSGCRPDELLKLKIKDVVVQQLDNGGYQIARIPVNGKTGQRSVRLYNSYPRLKEWLSNGHHPFPGNPNSPLFCGTGKKSIGRRILPNAIYAMYSHYKEVVFPKLLNDPLVPQEDKLKIKDMLKKKWNPHARRHTAATEISKAIKDPILINNYFGWSQTGTTRLKYQHYFADDTIDSMLTVMDGLPPLVASQTEQNKKNRDFLKPKQCPNCDNSNTPESKFCAKCKFVLSFDLYNETLEEKAKAAKEAEETKRILDITTKTMMELKSKFGEVSNRLQSDMELMKAQMKKQQQ